MTKVQKGLLCSKCSTCVIDFTDKNVSDFQTVLETATSPVCGVFKKSQLSDAFLKRAAAVLITTASMAAPTMGQEPILLDSIPIEEEVDDEFFLGIIIETMPEAKGGMTKFYENLNANLKFPKGLDEKTRVYIQFVVDTLGNMTEIKIIKGHSPSVDKEALRAIKKLDQKFTPGTQRGKPVRTRMTFPILFDPKKN